MSDQLELPDPERISRMLGLYKAEWLSENLFDFFSEPQYFAELKTPRPCVLIGGRGTGKTTVLKSLSYAGQFAIGNSNLPQLTESDFIGIYYRVNTNRVTAFKGGDISEEKWVRYFAHYLNLIFCLQTLDFVDWYSEKTGVGIELSKRAVELIAASFSFSECSDLPSLKDSIERGLIEFESSINSLSEATLTGLSLQGAPLDRLAAELLRTDQLRGKKFHFLIDEFENFEDYQQRIVNTLIKHASESYTFKVGVRELGWRQRATLNSNEMLTSPADYARINIGEVMTGASFKNFASDVVLSRLELAHGSEGSRRVLRELLPRLSDVEEADQLMEVSQKRRTEQNASELLGSHEWELLQRSHTLGEVMFVEYWNTAFGQESLVDSLRSFTSKDKIWSERKNNYFHSFLFSIRRGKSGIRKYYCGWDLYVRISDGNIRYLLELVHTAFRMHIDAKESGGISYALQTKAAQAVGKKNLDELQGLSVDGAQLTKLLLSLGRIFQLLAEDPTGHLAEATEFYIRSTGEADVDQAASRLINNAVMHLALSRSTANKLTDQKDVREYDYMVHPIFSAFFVFSSRRKRKIGISTRDVIQLVENPRTAIPSLLGKNNRANGGEVGLPDQMKLFGAFYD